MNTIDRYKILIRYAVNNGIVKSQKDLGRELGYTNESSFSQIINGKVKMPKDFTSKLTTVFPDLNIAWLLSGEGEMLKGQVDETEEEANPNTSDMTINRLLDALERRDQQVAEAMAQNSRLINVIERMQGISPQIGVSTPPHLQKPESTL